MKALSQATLVELAYAAAVRGYTLHGRADGYILSVQYGLHEAVLTSSPTNPQGCPRNPGNSDVQINRLEIRASVAWPEQLDRVGLNQSRISAKFSDRSNLENKEAAISNIATILKEDVTTDRPASCAGVSAEKDDIRAQAGDRPVAERCWQDS